MREVDQNDSGEESASTSVEVGDEAETNTGNEKEDNSFRRGVIKIMV
jgi:hypothetical protein